MAGILTPVTPDVPTQSAQASADAAVLSEAAALASEVATAADAISTAADAVATAADRVQTGLDATATAADVVTTNADAASTAADTASTAADVISTNADAASTAADVISTAASEAAALASLNDFKGRYYGALASDPALDPLGAAIDEGDLYWNTVSNELRQYDGAAWIVITGVQKTSDTGSAKIPTGTQVQRDAVPATGMIRHNSDTNKYEGYGNAAWQGLGGGATGGGSDAVFHENDQTVTADYTITAGKNAVSAGSITINTGVTVTVPTGARWVVV